MPDGSSIPREELIELAHADAIGVLDDVDSARFERAFQLATPSVQAEVRALQQRIASSPLFLADEKPAASLRLKTLARVASAIEDQAAAAQPIATIGTPRADARALQSSQQVAGSQSSEGDVLLRELLERASLERRPTHHMWRAAALFLFAALVVALYFQAEQRRISNRLMDLVDRKLVDEAAHAIARETRQFNFEGARELAVYDASGSEAKLVHAFLDESSGRICVYGVGCAVGGEPVRVRSAAGTLPVVTSVIEERGFAIVFDRPADVAALRLEIGGQAMTISV